VKDRSGTVIAVVAIGIAVLGLAALARSLLARWKGRRRFGPEDVARWLSSGWQVVRPVLPALIVLLAMWTAGELLRIHGWMKAHETSWPSSSPLSLPERLRAAAHLPGLPNLFLSGWRKLLPFEWDWPLGFFPILLTAAFAGRFPFSSTRAVARTWLAFGAVFFSVWLYGFAPAILPMKIVHPPLPAAAAVSLLFLLVGYPAFLMLLLGNVEPSAECRLEAGPAAAREVLLRLAALVASISIAGFDRSALLYARTLMGWNLGSVLSGVIGWSLSVAGFLLGTFASTTILPACSSSKPGVGFLRESGRWWKRDGLFLLLVPLAVTFAAWVVGFPIEVLLADWRSPASTGGLFRSDIRTVWGSLLGFAANLLAFLLLLGNWLEAREQTVVGQTTS
jgi:hypothetical protein